MHIDFAIKNKIKLKALKIVYGLLSLPTANYVLLLQKMDDFQAKDSYQCQNLMCMCETSSGIYHSKELHLEVPKDSAKQQVFAK